LKPPYALQVGQVLRLPDRPTHTVKRGETVYRIAQTRGVDMSALVRINDLAPPYTIHIGQVLLLPGSTGNPPSSPAPAVAAAPPSAAPAAGESAPAARRHPSDGDPQPRRARGGGSTGRCGAVVVPYGSVARGSQRRHQHFGEARHLGARRRIRFVPMPGTNSRIRNMLLVKH
jgi:murein DD-endopeptidase MepM/ murein hydrolase activator NlpD